MKKIKRSQVVVLLCSTFMSLAVWAGSVDFVPVWGGNVQQNFSNAETAINDNDARITNLENLVLQLVADNAALQQQNQQLQTQIDNLQQASGGIPGLADYVSVEIDQYGYPAVVFDSVNVHIRNGNPNTGAFANTGSNGLGNLIVGYNIPPSANLLGSQCSGGFFTNMSTGEIPTQASCEAAGHIWAAYHKTGSHNVIVGPGHSYTGANSIVAGADNMALDGMNLITGSYNLGGFAGVALNGSFNRAYFDGTLLGTTSSLTTTRGVVVGGDFNQALNDSLIIGGQGVIGDANILLDGEEVGQ